MNLNELWRSVPVAPTVEESATTDREAALTAELPPAEGLADRIVTDLGPYIAVLIAANPEPAKISDEELTAWISEDVEATIKEIAEIGWGMAE